MLPIPVPEGCGHPRVNMTDAKSPRSNGHLVLQTSMGRAAVPNRAGLRRGPLLRLLVEADYVAGGVAEPKEFTISD